MTWRIYIIPAQESLVGDNPFRCPKYLGGYIISPSLGLENIPWSAIDYGFEPIFMVAADVTAAQHTILAGFADVLAAPINLGNNLTAGAVTTVKNFLESINIPANWVSTASNYAQILKVVAGLFQFMQRLHTLHPNRLFQPGTTLATTFGELPLDTQTALIDAGNSFGYNTGALSQTTTLRVILKYLADQWANTPITLGAFTL